jgi:hypothetical protein
MTVIFDNFFFFPPTNLAVRGLRALREPFEIMSETSFPIMEIEFPISDIEFPILEIVCPI